MNHTDWDNRYDHPDYLFGEQPSEFLLRHTNIIKGGRTALAVADGEGRNGVWLAQQGLAVHSVDASAVGLEKARQLADRRGVSIATELVDLADYDWPRERFDLVVAIFIQFAGPDLRPGIFAGMINALRPGGKLLLHGYRAEQLAYGTGGPRQLENLYTAQMLTTAFAALTTVTISTYDAEIAEGTGHRGMSALIDLVATKPG